MFIINPLRSRKPNTNSLNSDFNLIIMIYDLYYTIIIIINYYYYYYYQDIHYKSTTVQKAEHKQSKFRVESNHYNLQFTFHHHHHYHKYIQHQRNKTLELNADQINWKLSFVIQTEEWRVVYYSPAITIWNAHSNSRNYTNPVTGFEQQSALFSAKWFHCKSNSGRRDYLVPLKLVPWVACVTFLVSPLRSTFHQQKLKTLFFPFFFFVFFFFFPSTILSGLRSLPFRIDFDSNLIGFVTIVRCWELKAVCNLSDAIVDPVEDTSTHLHTYTPTHPHTGGGGRCCTIKETERDDVSEKSRIDSLIPW